MSSGRSTIEPGQYPHKPAESGVPVGNAARFCSFQEVTRNAIKQVPLNKPYIRRRRLSGERFPSCDEEISDESPPMELYRCARATTV